MGGFVDCFRSFRMGLLGTGQAPSVAVKVNGDTYEPS